MPNGLPEWFVERDLDGDGQLTLAEFPPAGRPEESLDFESFDENRDGVITSLEGARVQTRRAAAEAEAAAQSRSRASCRQPGTAKPRSTATGSDRLRQHREDTEDWQEAPWRCDRVAVRCELPAMQASWCSGLSPVHRA